VCVCVCVCVCVWVCVCVCVCVCVRVRVYIHTHIWCMMPSERVSSWHYSDWFSHLYILGLFWHILGLFWHILGLFWHMYLDTYARGRERLRGIYVYRRIWERVRELESEWDTYVWHPRQRFSKVMWHVSSSSNDMYPPPHDMCDTPGRDSQKSCDMYPPHRDIRERERERDWVGYIYI
jgi:hypothetical protein